MNEKLRQARHDRHWSVDYAAKRIGVGRTTYLRWEQGTQIPHDSTLMLACKAFSLSPEKLGFGNSDNQSEVPAQPANMAFAEQLDPLDPHTVPRLIVWSFLTHEGKLASRQQILYDALTADIITMAQQWKLSSNTIVLLQESVYQTIRTCDTMPENQKGQDAKISRRNALQAIAQFPLQMYGLTRFIPEKHPLSSAEELLPLCAAGLTACQELRQHEPEGTQTIRRVLAEYLPALEYFARQSSSFQQSAAHLAAQSYLLVSVVTDHYGQLYHREAASRMARYYAQIAQDPNLEVSALTRLAVKFGFERCHLNALEAYQEALALPGFARTSPLLQGRIYFGLAGTYAHHQKSEQAFLFLEQAREIFPAQPEQDPNYFFAYSSRNTIPYWEGLTLKNAGHYSEALDVFLQSTSLTSRLGLAETHRAEFLNSAASVAVQQHDLDAASLYLGTAEEIGWTIQNEQRLAETRDTLRSMQLLWPDEPKVKQLQEKAFARQR